MSRRQITSTFSGAVRASSKPRISSCQCIYQQSRGYKYESYEERRQAAKEWAATIGQQYMRPRKGQTNYLRPSNRASKEEGFSLSRAQDGAHESEAAEETDPWEDEKTVDAIKKDFAMDDSKVNEYKQRFQGLTPNILRQAMESKMSDDEINSTIKEQQTAKEDAQFDANEVGRAQAAKKQQVVEKSKKDGPLRPFPMNPMFQSQPVLSEELREMIYLKVVRDGMTVRTVSTLMGVSMERVGAVVRMKQMERDWITKGKPLATPYSRAVLDMLPTTPFVDPSLPQNRDKTNKPLPQPPHEPINELPVHPSTTHQTFVSVPESRHFTRADAAKAFSPTLKSSDERIPHPELLAIEKVRLAGAGRQETEAFAASLIEAEKKSLEKKARDEARRERENTRVYEGKRWAFKFQDISVQDAGRDGRDRKGTGWRYGMPHEDRKRGVVKIPTSVP